MKRLLWLTMLCCLFVLTAQASDYVYKRNIPYRAQMSNAYADSMCRLDIASPECAAKSPVLVWFHGGGLTGGSREIPEELLKEGLIVVGVEYRLSPQVKTLEIVDDAAAAVAWVFNNIGEYGGDTSSIYIAGHSAGGYLVNMIGLDKSWLQKYNIDADSLAGIIPFSGQVITHFATRKEQGLS